MHEYVIPETFVELCNYVTHYDKCTIRTDHKEITNDLPFYIIDSTKKSYLIELANIWTEAKEKSYKLIVTNGIKYDPIQNYNFVVRFSSNGNFTCEASDLKVPLRHMYRYPEKLLSVSGNISDDIQEWKIYNNANGVNRIELKHDLEEVYTMQIMDRFIECTKYPFPVGIFKKQIVYWQIV